MWNSWATGEDIAHHSTTEQTTATDTTACMETPHQQTTALESATLTTRHAMIGEPYRINQGCGGIAEGNTCHANTHPDLQSSQESLVQYRSVKPTDD